MKKDKGEKKTERAPEVAAMPATGRKRYYIILKGSVYEVRHERGEREVLTKDRGWLGMGEFVDYLMKAGRTGELVALCEASILLNPEGVKRVLGDGWKGEAE